MPLSIKSEWLFSSPENGTFIYKEIPQDVVYKFNELILKISSQGNRKSIIEEYKANYCASIGNSYYSSSNVSWAESDLLSAMSDAAKNAALFIKSYFDVSEQLKMNQNITIPDVSIINTILSEGKLGYKINGTSLEQRDNTDVIIPVQKEIIDKDEKNYSLILESFNRSDKLLSQGYSKEAVQESLWLLETITTGFLNVDTESEKVEAKYFNQIIKELSKKKTDHVFRNVISWMMTLHGFLSSPTGGGIRHGMDLNLGNVPTIDEARLYFNLIRSYTYYIYSEYRKTKYA
jgi:hypothetical protein